MVIDDLVAQAEAFRSQGEQPGHVYALVDTNQQPNLNVMLEGRSRRTQPLSRSAKDGPILVEIDQGSNTVDWLLGEKRGERLGIFILSRSPFDEMWSHARRFTKVIKPDGEEASFRFYDPLVFNRYAGVLSEEQRGLLFARISYVFAEYGPYLMRTSLRKSDMALEWELYSDDSETETGEAGLPAIDLTNSTSAPLLRLSKHQYEFPVIFNMPALIEDVDAYLREDFERPMNFYAPGILRAMIEAAMRQALDVYKLYDLVVLRQFAELQWRVAPGFCKQPDIDALLRQTERPPHERWSTLLSPGYEDSLVEAYEFDRPEDWGVSFG